MTTTILLISGFALLCVLSAFRRQRKLVESMRRGNSHDRQDKHTP